MKTQATTETPNTKQQKIRKTTKLQNNNETYIYSKINKNTNNKHNK